MTSDNIQKLETLEVAKAERFIKIAGAIYIILGLLELTNFFYQKPIGLFKIFFWVSIGIGLYEKHSWSRTLCIIGSGITVISAVFLFIFSWEVRWNGLQVFSARYLIILMILVHSFLLYILLRKDVKNIFLVNGN